MAKAAGQLVPSDFGFDVREDINLNKKYYFNTMLPCTSKKIQKNTCIPAQNIARCLGVFQLIGNNAFLDAHVCLCTSGQPKRTIGHLAEGQFGGLAC